MATLIRGRVSVERLVRAISGFMERHPLLCSRVKLDEGGTVWLTPMGEPMPDIHVASREHPEDWVEHSRLEFRRRFDLLEGPLVRFVLIQSPKSSEVIVNCHHVICDGMSLAILMRASGRLTDGRAFEPQLSASLDPGLIDSFGLVEMGLLEDKTVKRIVKRRMADRRAGVLVSNLGRQEIPVRFGDLRVDALYGPCVHTLSEKYLGVVMVGGAMHLTFTFDNQAVPRRKIEGLRDAMMARLRG